MVTLEHWTDMLNVKDLLKYHKSNNIKGKFSKAIAKETRLIERMMKETLIINQKEDRLAA